MPLCFIDACLIYVCLTFETTIMNVSVYWRIHEVAGGRNKCVEYYITSNRFQTSSSTHICGLHNASRECAVTNIHFVPAENLIPSSSIMTSSFVLNQIQLMCLSFIRYRKFESKHPSHFGSNISPAIFFHRVLFFLSTLTNQKSRVRESSLLRKSPKRTNPVSPLSISKSIIVY